MQCNDIHCVYESVLTEVLIPCEICNNEFIIHFATSFLKNGSACTHTYLYMYMYMYVCTIRIFIVTFHNDNDVSNYMH